MYWKDPDSQGRVRIPFDLVGYANITMRHVAICYKSDSEVIIKVEDCINPDDIVLCFRNIDQKNRIVLPVELRESFSKFMVYVKNHELTIKGITK